MKPTSDSTRQPATRTVERRSFIWQAGAALSAGLASAAATAGTSDRKIDETRSLREQLERASSQVGLLEDTDAIRRLHHAFADALNNRLYAEIVDLFADDSEMHVQGETVAGKEAVRRLYVEHAGAVRTDAPVHAWLLEQNPQQHLVEVAPDRQSANGRFHCLIQMEATLPSNWPLVQMARQQGQGITQWWESGVFENTYVKDRGVWKIKQLSYRGVPFHSPYPPTGDFRKA